MPRHAASKNSGKSASKSGSRSTAKTSSQDALHLLAEDHKKVIELFDDFEELREENSEDEEAMQLLVENACADLTVHMQVEEELFYPAARAAAIDAMDLLDEAEVEHASARQLITELAAMQPGDDLYEAKFKVLGEYVKHHVQEEEKELFPILKKAQIDLVELGEEIMERKLELRDEIGAPGIAESLEDEDDDARSRSTRRNVH